MQQVSLSPLFSAGPGGWVAEVEHHTYFQLPVTYLTDWIT